MEKTSKKKSSKSKTRPSKKTAEENIMDPKQTAIDLQEIERKMEAKI